MSSLELLGAQVYGLITNDTVWTTAASPITVIDHVTVNEGVTLTIEPGVEVRFGHWMGLWIKGRLNAIGTASAPILFQGTTGSSGWWRGVHVIENGSAAFEWCQVAHSGYWEKVGIYKGGSGALVLRHSILREHDGNGLWVAPGYASFVSEGNTFQNNTCGVRVERNVSFDDLTSTFAGNVMDVQLDGGTLTQPVVWGLKPDYSFFVSGDVTVGSAATLTIRPGTILKFGKNIGLWVDGRLEVPATGAAPVYLTDWRDDTVGGDANRDGANTNPGPGWWRGVHLREAGSAVLSYCTMRYAGYWESVGLGKSGTGEMILRHCTVSDIQGHGLRVTSSPGNTELEACTFANNAQSGMYLNGGRVSAAGCLFSGNGDTGVLHEVNDGLNYAANQFSGNGTGSVGVNGGIMLMNLTWTRGGQADFAIVVRGDLTVAEGAVLTVEPGVNVRFGKNVGFWIKGGLTAVGAASAPVTFEGTSAISGWWWGLQLVEKGSATLEWCRVAHGGYWSSAGVNKSGSGALTLRNSILHDHTGDGLRVAAGYSSFVSENNTFQNNTRGVRVGLNASFDDATSVFTGNTMDVHLDGGTLNQSVVWGLNPDYSMFVSGDVTVGSTGTLTIRPGTVVKFAQNMGLWVEGKLAVPATDAAPVYLTDWRDDTVGGDANRDGANTKPGPGWWRALFVREAGSATLSYCTVRYAGYWESLGVGKSGTGEMSLRHCTVAQIQGHGLRVTSSLGNTLLETSTFANNTQSGMYLNSGWVAATNCLYADNGDAGVLQEANTGFNSAFNRFTNNLGGSMGINGGILTTNVTWTRGEQADFAVGVRGDLTVAEGATLTVAPGVNVRFGRYVGLWIKGQLNAVGTSLLPIILEGSSSNAQWWRGLQIVEKGSATLEWCQVTHSGYWENVGILKSGPGSLVLKGTTLHNNQGDALRIDNSTGSHQIAQCVFTGGNNGILVRNQSVPLTIVGSQIFANTSHGIQNQGTAQIDARQNWWGHASGPYHPTKNPNGQGNQVSDLVLFDPWSTEPPAVAPPQLSLEIDSAAQLVLSWPTSAAGFSLESSRNLHQWEVLTTGVMQIGDRFVFTTPMNDPARFFRLKK